MLNYLLNATTIWLACLLVYELLLRNETWHRYNRLYLNLSMLAGLMIPLLQWNTNTTISNPTLRQPAEQALMIRKTISSAAPDASNTPGVYNILLMVYAIGVVFFAVTIVREIVQLIKYYRKGTHIKLDEFTIIETQNEHGPFSIFKLIFVRSRAEFNDEQWKLLMMHEMQHSKLRHSIDKCFAILLRIVLWFHPLVHIYYKRLMIVHEYQADALAKNDSKVYGNFLLEQSLMLQAPMLAHSFNYSPLKNRIKMLTRKNSSNIRLMKYLAVIPILSLLILCCTKNSAPVKERKGNVIYFNGNAFELQSGQVDTFEVYDPTTNESKIVEVKKDSMIGKMNGEKVYDIFALSDHARYKDNKAMASLLVETLQTELSTLDNADYLFGVSDLIVDTKGALVYYNSASMYLYNTDKNAKKTELPPNVKAEMIRKLDEMFNAITGGFEPAKKDGKAVIGFVHRLMDENGQKIHVENHVATVR